MRSERTTIPKTVLLFCPVFRYINTLAQVPGAVMKGKRYAESCSIPCCNPFCKEIPQSYRYALGSCNGVTILKITAKAPDLYTMFQGVLDKVAHALGAAEEELV